jgi:ATP-dependent Clp protease protease subunit
MTKFWNFINKTATETEPENVELRIEGEIIDDDDMWLYELFGIKSISPNAFKTELKQYNGKPLNIWIDSYGGSVWAATGMYTELMERKGHNNIKIIKAMSAATIPAMSGKSWITPGGMFMIHDPLIGLEGYFNNTDLKQYMGYLDAVKETIIDAYQTKTSLSRNEIREMMANETAMSAKTAVKKGFVDELLYTDDSKSSEPIDIMFARRSILNTTSDALRRMVALQRPKPEDNALAMAKLKLQLQL